jgi:hypothetical protein
MELFHTTFAAEGRHALFPTDDARRWAVLTLARVAGRSLALFCIADDHVHLVIVGSRERATNLARALVLAFRRLAATRTTPPHHLPVRDRRHLETLVDYVLGQPSHHGLPGHPALWTGSAFLDLVGARHVPGLELRLLDVLPRLTPRRLRAAVGLADADIHPLPPPDVRRLGAFALTGSAAAALAAPIDLAGNAPPARSARLAVVRLARDSGIPPSEISASLGIQPRSVRRLAVRHAPPAILDAVRLRLGLEEQVRRGRPWRVGVDRSHLRE